MVNSEKILFKAIGSFSTRIVRYLLENDVSIVSEDMNPLHYAASIGYSSIIKFIVGAAQDKGESYIDIQDKKGYTALMYAAKLSDPSTLKELLKLGASADIQNQKGQTALHIAAIYGRDMNIKEILLKDRCDKIEDNNGKTAEECAKLDRTKKVFHLF